MLLVADDNCECGSFLTLHCLRQPPPIESAQQNSNITYSLQWRDTNLSGSLAADAHACGNDITYAISAARLSAGACPMPVLRDVLGGKVTLPSAAQVQLAYQETMMESLLFLPGAHLSALSCLTLNWAQKCLVCTLCRPQIKCHWIGSDDMSCTRLRSAPKLLHAHASCTAGVQHIDSWWLTDRCDCCSTRCWSINREQLDF